MTISEIKDIIKKHKELSDFIFEFVTGTLYEIDEECLVTEHNWIDVTAESDNNIIVVRYDPFFDSEYEATTYGKYKFPIRYLTMSNEDIAKEIYEK